MENPARTEYSRVAEFYDTWHDRWPDSSKANCVEMLAEIADGKTVLELAVGTGRIALPLAMKGLRVFGIDNSAPMLEKLRTKPGADRLSVVLGDLAEVPLDGPFGLIYVVFSFGYLLTQEEQLRCIVNVGKKLTENGAFVIQTMTPGETIFDGSGGINDMLDVPSTDGQEADSIMLLGAKTDLVRQMIHQRVIVLNEAGSKIYPHTLRYVWPAELDLMARIAGLKLHARWGSWRRDAFTSKCRTQISVYKLAI